MGCCPCSKVGPKQMTQGASESNQISTNSSTGCIIHRLAINQSAVIGSFYDARLDHLLEVPPLSIPIISNTPLESAVHRVVDTGILEGTSLTKMINIDKELCLSIYLNIIATKGISRLLKYPYTIDKHTRFFSYYCETKKTHWSGEQKNFKSNDIGDSTATHVVTEIQLGVHVIVILQLSPEYELKLDRLLEALKKQLAANNFRIEPEEEDLFNQFTDIHVFSNIPDLENLTKFIEVYWKISEIASNITRHRPIEYTLQPIRSFFSSYPENRGICYSLKEEYMNQVDAYFYQLLLIRKSIKAQADLEIEERLKKYLKQQFKSIEEQKVQVEELYKEVRQQYYDFIVNIRNGEVRQDAVNQLLTNNQYKMLLEKSSQTNDSLNALSAKARIIKYLGEKGIKYRNVKGIVGNDDESLETIQQKLLKKYQNDCIFCFDDKLEQVNSLPWNDLYQQLIDESRNASSSRCIYADFSYCSCRLIQMKMISSRISQEQQNGSSTIDFINVLLLGESGVGKSTFINALANYLMFDTLEQAHSKKPLALIPVSFLMTEGDDFQERTVRFGHDDSNEDYDHPGQSVTQQCRSYVFNIDNHTKIRFIDTPGMGDTRGLDQDDLNMQHILSFINNLSHLNALCILLKPNQSKLNVVFRSYFTRLIGFLGEHVRNNIIFCFTNTRSTFFSPGDTGPLLKKMLQSQPISDIPFGKPNTFCFDSESFRYLIALLDGIKFDDDQKEEYLRCWTASVNESNRFLDYLHDKLKPYSQNRWQSIEHAQFQITLLVRPMLETLRNLFRNVILQKDPSSQLQIELRPKPLSRSSTICLKCKPTTEYFSKFLVVPDKLHKLSGKCKTCDCDKRDHINIDYKLEYENSNNPTKKSSEKIKSELTQVKTMILELAYFFTSIAPHTETDDPIIKTLTQVIAQEKQIYPSENSQYLNPKLLDKLHRFNEAYKQERNNQRSNRNSINLSTIYQLIDRINAIHSIQKQIDTVKQFRQKYMKDQEKEIHNDVRSKRH